MNNDHRLASCSFKTYKRYARIMFQYIFKSSNTKLDENCEINHKISHNTSGYFKDRYTICIRFVNIMYCVEPERANVNIVE